MHARIWKTVMRFFGHILQFDNVVRHGAKVLMNFEFK